ncbi:hypothetical protein GCG54_00015295 [Colletotrichum gloeosporioides]|uniref:Uncharacterized protein n=1 Tax=Colletotrichum gloeosporioides TaxID=474922 RepID=A0A8H4FEN0_COLGL|nr:uncharacterized protein GCG54_00015295 [Colletotrichum gloeosporioides]KAF3799115.1 hypothetical protein GCG54_00015295 [Colletotrichum gloeosporioides]
MPQQKSKMFPQPCHPLADSLICRRHHEIPKLAGTEELKIVTIVLTTYHRVAAEWKASKSGRKSTIFSCNKLKRSLHPERKLEKGQSGVCAGGDIKMGGNWYPNPKPPR